MMTQRVLKAPALAIAKTLKNSTGSNFSTGARKECWAVRCAICITALAVKVLPKNLAFHAMAENARREQNHEQEPANHLH